MYDSKRNFSPQGLYCKPYLMPWKYSLHMFSFILINQIFSEFTYIIILIWFTIETELAIREFAFLHLKSLQISQILICDDSMNKFGMSCFLLTHLIAAIFFFKSCFLSRLAFYFETKDYVSVKMESTKTKFQTHTNHINRFSEEKNWSLDSGHRHRTVVDPLF